MDLFAVRFKLTVYLVNLHLHEMVVHIFAWFHLGGLWQSGLNAFLPCRFSLYLVLLKRYDYFPGLFPD